MAGLLFLLLALASSPAPVLLVAAIVIHEAGHVLSARSFGWRAPALRLRPCGLCLEYSGQHSPLQSLAVALSGSFAGAAAAFVFFKSKSFFITSLGFSLLNLLPVRGLDGGEALLVILESFFLPDRAYCILRAFSVATVLLFFTVSLFVQMKAGANLTLLALTVYLTVTVMGGGE